MPTPTPPASTKSGITTSASGTRVIPSSTRADGSTRKEIRVRPGYRPPEDVEVYKNRTAEAFKNRGKGGVPGAEGLKEEASVDAKTGAAAKNAKRREARKKAKATGEAGQEEEVDEVEAADGKDVGVPDGDATTAPATSSTTPASGSKTEDEIAQAERNKTAKKLKKKLREARELQAKKEKGEGLLQEQFDKVIKIKELMRDLERLGVDDDDAGQAPEKA